MKEKIAKWFWQGLWTSEMVLAAVNKGYLSQEDGQKIRKGEKLD